MGSFAELVASYQKLLKELANSPDVSRGPLLERLMWTLMAFSIIVVSLRLYTKCTRAKRLYIDDWLMVAALIVGIGHAITVQLAINHGLGRHINFVLTRLSSIMKPGSISLLFGYLSPCLGRISFLYTLLFLAKTDARVKTWSIYMFIMGQVLINVTGIVVFYAQCGRNIDVLWNLKKSVNWTQYCWDPAVQTYYQYFMGVFNTITDVHLAVLPAILVHHTNMSVRRKIGVASLLCLSTFAMAASAVKTYEAKALSRVADYTYSLCVYIITMIVELNVVIIASSLPLIRPLFVRPKKQPEIDPSGWQDHIPLSSSLSSKNQSRTNTADLSSDSKLGRASSWDDYNTTSPGITVTREVEVTYESMDAYLVHAALVGLLQRESSNSHFTHG